MFEIKYLPAYIFHIKVFFFTEFLIKFAFSLHQISNKNIKNFSKLWAKKTHP